MLLVQPSPERVLREGRRHADFLVGGPNILVYLGEPPGDFGTVFTEAVRPGFAELEGLSATAAARRLKERGIQTPRGGK